ncbi:MAG: NADH-quinone oxidoreductase subunit NuoH [Cryobacterium sp.]|nr:NADH-quinone oxidoreductase subunit NuoH [Oligoflexia bacterium]
MGLKIAVVVVMLLQVVPIMVWVERRGSALLQNRLGPNRIGPLGLFQSLVDAVKMMTKEDRATGHVNPFYYRLAPLVSLLPAFLTFAAIPFASHITMGDKTVQFQIADLNVGLLYILSVTSLSVYGIIMGSWASNNKYSMLGGLRSTAQMISYELSMGLAIIGIVMIFGSIQMGDIATAQGATLIQLGPIAIPKWGVFLQPLGFIIFLICTYAETNRLPFDLPEGESEIVAGYHLEYYSMMFGMFMMAEYINMTVASAFVTTLYFGGWQLLPGMTFLLTHSGLEGMNFEWARVALEAISFVLKVAFFMWLFVWVRWTIPRFRYDQVMHLGWKVLLPLSLLNILITGFLIYLKVL